MMELLGSKMKRGMKDMEAMDDVLYKQYMKEYGFLLPFMYRYMASELCKGLIKKGDTAEYVLFADKYLREPIVKKYAEKIWNCNEKIFRELFDELIGDKDTEEIKKTTEECIQNILPEDCKECETDRPSFLSKLKTKWTKAILKRRE